MSKWLALIFLPVLLALGVTVAVDESIDPGLQALLDQPDRQVLPERNLYLAFLGFNQHPDQPLHISGLQVRDSLLANLGPTSQATENIDAPAARTKLVHNEDIQKAFDLYSKTCSPEGNIDLVCSRLLQEIDQRSPHWLNDNRQLIERYRQLRQYGDYRDTLRHHFALAELVPLHKLQWLFFLDVTRTQTRGDSAAAVRDLYADIRFLRFCLGRSESLIDKMIMALLLERDLVLLSSMIPALGDKLQPMAGDAARSLAMLTPEKATIHALLPIDMTRYQSDINLIGKQLWMGKDPYKDLYKFGVTSPFPDTAWQRLLLAPFLKPNATVNASYRARIEDSGLDKSQMPISGKPAAASSEWSAFVKWLNITGRIILAHEKPYGMAEFRARLEDLDRYMRLIALQAEISISEEPVDIDNRIGPDVKWHEARWALAFEPRSERWRTMPVGINGETKKSIYVSLPNHVTVTADSFFGLTAECPSRKHCVLRSKSGKVFHAQPGQVLIKTSSLNMDKIILSELFPRVMAISPNKFVELEFLIADPYGEYEAYRARIRTNISRAK
jgi:hypothetical protein